MKPRDIAGNAEDETELQCVVVVVVDVLSGSDK